MGKREERNTKKITSCVKNTQKNKLGRERGYEENGKMGDEGRGDKRVEWVELGYSSIFTRFFDVY